MPDIIFVQDDWILKVPDDIILIFVNVAIPDTVLEVSIPDKLPDGTNDIVIECGPLIDSRAALLLS